MVYIKDLERAFKYVNKIYSGLSDEEKKTILNQFKENESWIDRTPHLIQETLISHLKQPCGTEKCKRCCCNYGNGPYNILYLDLLLLKLNNETAFETMLMYKRNSLRKDEGMCPLLDLDNGCMLPRYARSETCLSYPCKYVGKDNYKLSEFTFKILANEIIGHKIKKLFELVKTHKGLLRILDGHIEINREIKFYSRIDKNPVTVEIPKTYHQGSLSYNIK